MDFTQLACFVRAYERQSFSQAAADLYLAQTSLTYRIASLEKELGCELFVRSKRGVVPTAAARAAYEDAKALLEGETRFVERVRAAADQRAHLVRLGFNRYPSVPYFFDAVDRYKADHPGITVDADFTYLDDPVGAIESATHDVVLLLDYAGYGERIAPPLEFVPLGKLRYRVIMAQGHPLSARSELTLDDLAGQTVYVLKALANTVFQVPAVEELRAHGAVVDDSMSDNDLLILAIRQGSGISVYPASSDEAQPGYARRLLTDCPPLPYGLLYAADRVSPVACAFIDALTATLGPGENVGL